MKKGEKFFFVDVDFFEILYYNRNTGIPGLRLPQKIVDFRHNFCIDFPARIFQKGRKFAMGGGGGIVGVGADGGNPFLLIVIVCLVIFVVLLAGIFLFLWRKARASKNQTQNTQQQTNETQNEEDTNGSIGHLRQK